MNNTVHIIDVYCDIIRVKGFCCIVEFIAAYNRLDISGVVIPNTAKTTPSLLIVRNESSEIITNLIFEAVEIKSEPENIRLGISASDYSWIKPVNLSGFSYLGRSDRKCWFVKIVRK